MMFFGLFGKLHEDQYKVLFPEHVFLSDNLWSIFEEVAKIQDEGWETRPPRVSDHTWFENNHGSYLALVGYSNLEMVNTGFMDMYLKMKLQLIRSQHDLKQKIIEELQKEKDSLAEEHDELLDKVNEKSSK